MGVIAGVIEEAEARTDSDTSAPDDSSAETPYLSQEITETLDPFFTEFDLSNVRLDREDAKIILGTLLVVSNIFGN